MSASSASIGREGGAAELRERIHVELASANKALDHFEVSGGGCACGFVTGTPQEIGRHLAEAPRARARVLRRLLRAHVASAVLDDLEGELLTKEIWEMCESADDAQAVRGELQILVVDVLLGRSCCIPPCGGACPGCGYPRAYAHPDYIDAALYVDAVFVNGSAVKVEGDSGVPRGVVRIVHGAHRGFECVDHPIFQDPGEPRETPL